MSKPLHQELLEAGVRQAPEAESADRLWERLVRPSRAFELAAVVAVTVAIFQAVQFFAGFGLGLGVAIAFGIVWVVLSLAADDEDGEDDA